MVKERSHPEQPPAAGRQPPAPRERRPAARQRPAAPACRRVLLERIEGVAGELALLRAGRRHLEIIVNGVFLASTYNRRSEQALAELALAACPSGSLRVLVGGLGAGWTLARVLADPRVGRVTLVELEPAILEWNRRYFPVSAAALADPRVSVVVGDLFRYLRDLIPSGAGAEAKSSPPAAGTFEIILCDIDNGPDWLVRPENHAVYSRRGLEFIRRALRPDGVAAFWSAGRAAWFTESLASAGFEVTVHAVTSRHVLPPDLIYLARRLPESGCAK